MIDGLVMTREVEQTRNDWMMDPYGYDHNKKEIKYKKAPKVRRKMASIHQFKALSNIIEAAKARDGSDFELPDSELYSLGVRPGQVWKFVYSDTQYHLAFVGYHEKGFLMLNLKAEDRGAIPPVSLFKYPRKLKTDLLRQIKKGEAKMLSCVSQDLIDETGNALPGREMDVMFASLMARPTYWKDPQTAQELFLSVCKEGHYRVSNWFLPSGLDCTEECEDAKDTIGMSILIDRIFYKVYYGATISRGASELKRSELKPINDCLVPFGLVESAYETYRILGANTNRVSRQNFSPEVEADPTTWKEMTNAWASQVGISSGKIFKIRFASKEMFVKLHRRKCGFIHGEINEDGIFRGETDSALLRRVLSSNRTPEIRLDIYRSLDANYPMTRCPCCSSKDPILCFPDDLIGRTDLNLRPHVFKAVEKLGSAVPGDFVRYRGREMLVYKTVQTRRKEARQMLVDARGKVTTALPTNLRKIAHTDELHKKFFSSDLLLNVNFSPMKWHKLVVAGSMLRVRNDVENPDLRPLAGKVVTVMSPPEKIGVHFGVKTIESDTIINLNRDVVPVKTTHIDVGTRIKYGDEEGAICEIAGGQVILEVGDRQVFLPEPALHLMLNRGSASIQQRYTVESLLAD